jgi:hypothetical protein
MRASRLALAVAVAFLSSSYLSFTASAQQSDQDIAERALGAHWKQMSRRAGMIFSGTVLRTEPRTSSISRIAQGTTPTVEINFRVDEAIAGVERGQILKIKEWSGASTMHRPLRAGQHILIFLYPPSRLGLTSPVGGSMGQVALNATGKNVSPSHENASASFVLRSDPPPRPAISVDSASVSVVQLERAIRSVREAQEQ